MFLTAFIAKRLAFNPQKSFSRFVMRLSIGATVISVMVMIVALAFAEGFQQTISDKIFSFWGHIRIHNYEAARVTIAEESPIRRTDSVTALPEIVKGIRSIHAYGTKNAILKSTESLDGVLFKGVEQDYGFENINRFLVRGRWIDFNDSTYSSEVNLSETMARELLLDVGDRVVIYFIQPGGATPRPRRLTVAGIYKTGIEEYDRLVALGDLRLIQRLNDWSPDQIGGYEVILHDYTKMDEINESILMQIPIELGSHTIREIFPNIFDWLNLQDKTIAIVLVIMVIIAILNLVICLLILVLERTRMVGVLKALGANNRLVRNIFLYQGGMICLAGLAGGNLLGLGFCWLQQRYGFITLPEDAYYISQAAVEIVWWQILLVNLGTFLICMAVLTLPALIVRQIQPVRAIQFR